MDNSLIFAKRKICPNPFLSLEIHADGNVSVCCTGRLKNGYKYVGNILINTLDEIWNGQKIQDFRKIVYDGQYERICESFCPQLVALKEGKTPPWYAHLCETGVRKEIEEGRIVLDSSYKAISVASDGSCNLFCIMCRSARKAQSSELEKKVNTVLYDQLLKNIHKISFLELTGDGDPFFNQETVKFLDLLSERDVGHLVIRFITNAQLLNERRWERVKKIKTKAFRVSVSIDAATKQTYESIRRGGDWDTLIRNMEMLSKERQSGALSYFQVSFVVMKRNIHEMTSFVELARSWHCDRIEFQRIMGDAAGLENIFDIEDPDSLEKLAEVLKSSTFNNKEFIDVSSFVPYKDYRATKQKKLWYKVRIIHYQFCDWLHQTMRSLRNSYRLLTR
jgi:MoaA/NifB/PqqE/SkfB family radical SAM enzyme